MSSHALHTGLCLFMPRSPRYRGRDGVTTKARVGIGHSYSVTRSATYVLAIMVRCWKCGDDRHLPMATLVARYGPGPRISDVVHRLRCRFPSCRSKPD